MTMMADFLLQPAASKKGVQAPQPDASRADALRPSRGGQDFSRVLHQQRQSADIKASTPPPRKEQPPRASTNAQTESRRDNGHDERRVDTDKQQSSAATAADTGERQNYDASMENTEESEESAEAVGKDMADSAEVPGLLDPLLEQILQVRNEQSADAEDPLQPLSDEQVAAQMLMMIQGGSNPAQASSMPVAGRETAVTQGTTMPSGVTAMTEEAVAETGEAILEGESLSLELDGSDETGQPLASQLLAAAATGSGRAEAAAQTAGKLEGVASGGEARTDALLRSEAVQSTQAARQLPGQAPLNMQQPGWSKELVDKVMWLSSQNLKSAEIKLNPAELGRLDIRVQVGQEHTQITFASAHAGVRDSLDGQMHRLREMLEQQGMHNVDVEVADQSRQEHQQTAGGGSAGGGHGEAGNDEELVAVSEVEQQERGHAGLVSYYV